MTNYEYPIAITLIKPHLFHKWDTPVKIFNNPAIQNQEKVKQALLSDEAFDFEAVYSKIMNDNAFEDGEKRSLNCAVEESFEALDEIVRSYIDNNLRLHKDQSLPDFLRKILGMDGKRGFFFTLNQDLFVERRLNYYMPGIDFPTDCYKGNRYSLTRDDFAILPKEEGIKGVKEGLISRQSGIIYIKLHGSYGWLSSNGYLQMVIGTTKKRILIGSHYCIGILSYLKM